MTLIRRQRPRCARTSWPKVRRLTLLALLMGLAALVAAVAYAGAGAVASALHSLRLTGLLLLVLVHVPMVGLMGAAWWLASGPDPPARLGRYIWARAVRDAAAEALPFLQFGGVVFGVRALGPGRAVAVRGAAAATIDGLVELAAKLPYVLAALLALLALAPQTQASRLERPLLFTLLGALGITAALVSLAAIPYLARRTLGAVVERAVGAASRRLPSVLSLDGEGLGALIGESFSRIVRERRRLWLAFGLHLLCWYLGAAEVWLAFDLLGHTVSGLQALAIDGSVAALRTFGVLVPAAAGVQEASYLAVAAVLGLSPATAVAAALARRARDLTLAIATLGVAVSTDKGLRNGAFGRGGGGQHAPGAQSSEGSPSPEGGSSGSCSPATVSLALRGTVGEHTADRQQCAPPGGPCIHPPVQAAHHERK